ncbi:MAG: hypothetical protein M3R13_01675 [Armatimonadota bacterium]|nr:hypothetical protein [Armatimonadota bacterium]
MAPITRNTTAVASIEGWKPLEKAAKQSPAGTKIAIRITPTVMLTQDQAADPLDNFAPQCPQWVAFSGLSPWQR